MKQIKIKGKNKLTGTIRISGAKNAAVALIPAAILSDEDVTICNVPEIAFWSMQNDGGNLLLEDN